MTSQKDITSTNQRIARNAVMLYIRMFLTMIVGLYTSRVVLNVLGVEDYGIYGVVGGIVAMMGFLNASMSGATSRFLTFELGRGDQKRLADTFSSALIVHMIIALIVLVVAETVGLWFLTHKLVIPAGRMPAAHWVFQLSILSTLFGITQVPYNATIIAHEKMDVYAYVEILNVTLKLLVVYLLTIGHFDKLILYAVLLCAVGLTTMLVYRIYCIRHFTESRFHWIWEKSILKPLLSFSVYDLYGNGCVTARQQGKNFLINIFFGVTYNAASSIATTVNGLILGLVWNVIQAFRPVIIKNFASNNLNEMQLNLNNALKYTLLLFGCIFVPLFLELPYLFQLWLVDVPELSVLFCRYSLVAGVIGIVNSIISISIHATGKIKALSFISGTLYLLTVPVVYLLFSSGFPIESAYQVSIICNVLLVAVNFMISKCLIRRLKIAKLLSSMLIALIVSLIASIPTFWTYSIMGPSIWRVIFISIVNILLVAILTYTMVFDRGLRSRINHKLCRQFQS